jgi:hypothetical protein
VYEEKREIQKHISEILRVVVTIKPLTQ